MIDLMAAAALVLAAHQMDSAQTDRSDYRVDRFAVTVEEIADGVHVMRRDPSWRLPVQATTTLIVNAQDAILIDGGFGAHAEHVVAQVRRITDNPVSVIVNTHWHGDHNVGHYVFKRVWPDARVIAHEYTRAAMAEDGVMDYVAAAGARSDEEILAPTRARLAELEADGASDRELAYYGDVIAGLPEVRDDYARWEIVLADETFTDRLTLHRGERRIELLHLGHANTPGDVVVWLPGERIVFAGDTVVRPTPYGFGSSPAAWADMLRALNALDYAILVPGHGDVQYDIGYVSLLARTMDHVAAQACAAVAEGAGNGDAVYAAIDWGAVEAEFTGGDAFIAGLFDRWFKRPISASAFQEIEAGETAACG